MMRTFAPRRVARLALPALAAAALAAPLAAQTERFTVAGQRVAVHNLAGEVTVAPGTGSAVVVEVTRAGADRAQLRVTRGSDDGYQALRVVFPGDRVVYPRLGGRSRSTLQVRRDGSIGGGGLLGGSRRVTVAGSGRGTRAHADVRVLVPAGKTVAVHQGVGRVQVSNVNGELRLHTASASVSTQGTRGGMDVEVGSGSVEVRGAQGDVDVSTGSGAVTVGGVRGTQLDVSTGSGSVNVTDVRVQEMDVEVGSGSVTLGAISARDVSVTTGSGAVRLGLASDAERVEIGTGSGGVTLTVPASFGAQVEVDTGSGGIQVDLPVTNRRSSRGEYSARVGDGGGRVRIETGSGGVRIRRG